MRRLVPTVVAVGVLAAGCVSVLPPPPPPPPPARPPPPAPTLTQDVGPPVQINGVDLHDGMIVHYGPTYYLYGTEYACGFRWGDASTPWCGFGVSSAPSLNGPWTAPTLLFSPGSTDSWTGTTWDVDCRGYGCFNPRMVHRSDGVFLLYFNTPGDYARTRANAYYVMGCNGPAGPCGDSAGPPYGSTRKPPLYICSGNGDFSFTVVSDGSVLWMFCTQPDQTLAAEELDQWGTNGTNVGAANLARLASVESPGVYHDGAANVWVLTYSDPNCGYCAGTGTGYATASAISGSWTRRGSLSARSCAGQPRDVDLIDGHVYEQIDQWYGDLNETRANTVLAPLAGMECPGGNAPSLKPAGTIPTSTTSAPGSPTSKTALPAARTLESPTAASVTTRSTAPGSRP
jgi:hypothetical protein